MEDTSSQVRDGSLRRSPRRRIGRSLLKEKKSEYRVVMLNANRALKMYAAEFRKLKNLENTKWKLMLKNDVDKTLVELMIKHLAAVTDKVKLLKRLLQSPDSAE